MSSYYDYAGIQIAIPDCVIKKGGGIHDPWYLCSSLSEAASETTEAETPMEAKVVEAEAPMEAKVVEAEAPMEGEGLCLGCC
jgi:hypothetical protein